MAARIQVHPMSVGPTNAGAFELFCAPYPLGCLVAYAAGWQSGALQERFGFGAITPTFYADALALVDAVREPGVFLFSSYVWNHAANVTVAERVKRRLPESLVVFGGPHLPRRQAPLREFFAQHPAVDLVVRGEGEECLVEVLQAIDAADVPGDALRRADFSRIPGITYRRGDLHENPDRERPKTLDAFPSPYGAGLFDHWMDAANYMVIETNRGCPYGCTFCDWGGATLSKTRNFALARVFADIAYAGRHRIETLYVSDANFGIFKRDVEIAEQLAAVHRRTGFPRCVSYNSAKTIRTEQRQIVKTMKDAGLIANGLLSLQTTDAVTLDAIHRSNIKVSEYRKLIAYFRAEQIPGVSELMIGLPGQRLQTCRADLQFLFDHRIHARIFPTLLMPNAPMADPAYRAQYAIEADADGFVQATSTFTREEYARMGALCRAYKLLGNMGSSLAKYLLLFLQHDRGLRALDVIAAWLEAAQRGHALFPASHRLWSTVLAAPLTGRARDTLLVAWSEADAGRVFAEIDVLLTEILDVCRAAFEVDVRGSDVDAVVAAQRAILPRRDARPGNIPLAHDVRAYFAAMRSVVDIQQTEPPLAPLATYGPGVLSVHEGHSPRAFDDFAAPAVGFELASNLGV